MQFTYASYLDMIGLLKECGYAITDYRYRETVSEGEKCVILRHDIDYDVDKALKLAELEGANGVKSTYFVLLTSSLYNVFDRTTSEKLKKIRMMGHDIGLHYDEVRYPDAAGDATAVVKTIQAEAAVLSDALETDIGCVSMHRPSKAILEADILIPGMINSYGKEFFNDFKYLSDSRKRWREPAKDIIKSGTFQRLHILTHAFWYDESECSLHDSVLRLINSGNRARYEIMKDNITDLDSIIDPSEVI